MPPERREGSARAGHRFVDHTSEITLEVWAPSFPELVEEASRAYLTLVPASARPTAETSRAHEPDAVRGVRLEGVDRAAALVAWLNELVYLGEAEQWLPTEVEASLDADGGLRVLARGGALREPFVKIKAATLHRASVREEAGRLIGEVTLDI